MRRFFTIAGILAATHLANFCHAQWIQLPGENNHWCISMHANDSYIFVGTQDSGILRTSNFGQTWEEINTGLPDSIYPHRLYGDDEGLFLGTHTGGFVSTNNGEQWRTIPVGVSMHILEFLRYGRYLFMAGDSAILYRSSDNGETWKISNTGIPGNRVIYAMAADEKHIYATIAGNGIYRSADSGSTWSAVPNNEKFSSATSRVMAAGKGLVIAPASSMHFVASTDNGETWEYFIPKLPRAGMSTIIWSMAIYEGTLYLGGEERFFRSTDLGKTWDTISAGFDPTAPGTIIVTDISITSTQMILGSITSWVWGRLLSEVLPPAGIDAVASPYAIRLEQSIPNPTSAHARISYTLPFTGHVVVKLYNAASMEIGTLVNERQEAGEHAMVVDMSDLPAGIYYYRLSVDGSSLTRRMLVVK
jgi:photosystem II stability/assembly factor-like uncharacterized protein